MTEASEKQTEIRKPGQKTGTVRARSGAKTVSVVLQDRVVHPVYGKYVTRQRKLAVHDPKEQAAPGDLVVIAPCRRVSKNKSWRLVRVVRSASPVTGQ